MMWCAAGGRPEIEIPARRKWNEFRKSLPTIWMGLHILVAGVGTLYLCESAGALHKFDVLDTCCYVGGILLGSVLVSAGALTCALARPLSEYQN